MNRTSLAVLLCAATLSTLVACSQTTDLGFTCEMTKQAPGCEGEEQDCTVNIDPADITDTELGYPTLDYLAEGVAECDDLICLRSRNRSYDDTSSAAMGYCTAPCQDDADCSPDFEGKKNTLKCKQLLNENGASQAKYCVLPETMVAQGAERE